LSEEIVGVLNRVGTGKEITWGTDLNISSISWEADNWGLSISISGEVNEVIR
jgi:hypothetical protein